MNVTSKRTGVVRRTLTGYDSFIPNRLPPTPPITIDDEMQYLLSMADRKLGRLDGITRILPNPDLFLAMYVQKEALLSSQIEGTQASLVDVLDEDADAGIGNKKRNDIEDVVNYVKAMNYGIDRLSTLPLSLRLIREIHAILLKGVRGSDRSPGEFRKTQNWIGPMGCTLETATFVPPPADEMLIAMHDLEQFFYDENYIPPLIKIAIIHAQFETIHPFLDGNGRVGRLLITFWLCEQEILTKPLLYLSYFFKLNRTEYYDRLMDVRLKGDWENWVKFFLKGVAIVSDESINSATEILSLKNDCAARLSQTMSKNVYCQQLLDYLFSKPIITRKEVQEKFKLSSPTVGTLLDVFCQQGILHDNTPEKKRGKKYFFSEYLTILNSGID